MDVSWLEQESASIHASGFQVLANGCSVDAKPSGKLTNVRALLVGLDQFVYLGRSQLAGRSEISAAGHGTRQTVWPGACDFEEALGWAREVCKRLNDVHQF
ncbi:hypothetical protein AB5J62_29855 [Amycolatopsis sp. cg5]|uniref:hypothetical protein n=1 Tax=Amycolatopsis sp. cg5 TaxID=3238802 RepID=UPI0035234B06